MTLIEIAKELEATTTQIKISEDGNVARAILRYFGKRGIAREITHSQPQELVQQHIHTLQSKNLNYILSESPIVMTTTDPIRSTTPMFGSPTIVDVSQDVSQGK
nr:hypothetical protein Iba_chr09bCG10320 [Ipomoea batatas]